MNNLYWAVYQNLEKELLELSNQIHIDDKQLEVYSIKISELLLRSVVEIESIVKELYFSSGGNKVDDKDLYFDTDCIDLLETNWKLSEKVVLISAPNFYFKLNENKSLKPLRKANKRGSSSSDWQKAYQAVKHNRVKNIEKGNLKHLIRAMAALYILNIYYNDITFDLAKDSFGTTFDNSLGSSLFSIKTQKSNGININSVFKKNIDFDECVYLINSTNETREIVQNSMKTMNQEIHSRLQKNLILELQKRLPQLSAENKDKNIKTFIEKIEDDIRSNVFTENGHNLNKAFNELKYQAILNKQQY